MAKNFSLSTRSVTVTTTSSEILPPASKRDYLHIRNDGANTVFVSFGDTAASADSFSLKLVSGEEKEYVTPGTGAVQAIALIASVNLTITTNSDNT